MNSPEPSPARPRPTMADALAILKKVWGYDAFRSSQVELLSGILEGRDVLGIQPTGSGKTIIFQVPALLHEGTSVVLSPLIALMKDQVDDCVKRGIAASYVNSHVDEFEVEERLNAFAKGAYKLFYVAPERMNSQRFRDALMLAKISMLVIDECHCASRWGHDFRPAYGRIKQILEWVTQAQERPQVVALTATATQGIEDDVAKSVGLSEDYLRVVGDPIRPNFTYNVTKGSEWSMFRNACHRLNPKKGRYVVYSTTRAGCEKLAEIIADERHEMAGHIGFYHAGMDKADRERVQDGFKNGTLSVVVATNAFGMGIDVPDIREVIHFGVPSSIEDYCQEAGRGGRDGLPTVATLIYSEKSVELRQMFLDSMNPPYAAFRTIWQWLHEHNARCAVVSKTGDQIAEDIAKTMRVSVTPDAVRGVLSIMDSYGVLNRLPADHAISIGAKFTECGAYLNSGRCTPTQTAVLSHFIAKYSPDPKVADPKPEAAAVRRPPQVKSLNDRIKATELATTTVLYDRADAAKVLNLTETAIHNAMRKFAELDLLTLGQVFRGKTTQVPRHMWGQNIEEYVPEADINAKRSREQDRLDAMVRYCHVADRVAYVRKYFMEG